MTIGTQGNRSFRLKSKKDIDTLFQTGKAFSVFPLKVLYQFSENNQPHSGVYSGFGVAKKRFKKAVDRNTIKRRMRAQWHHLAIKTAEQLPKEKYLQVFFLFTGSAKEAGSSEIELSMNKWFHFIQTSTSTES